MEPTLDEALNAPLRAQQAMQQGDWDKFGKAMAALKLLLANPAM
jgi:hypothetical protein